MSHLSTEPKKKLPLVEPRHELSGKFPRRFESLARSATTGSAAHRGLMHTATSLSRWALCQALPPSERRRALLHNQSAERWARDEAEYALVKTARAKLFDEAREYETCTAALLSEHLPHAADAFDAHADRVVLRYVGLAVHHAVNAALSCLDGVLEPSTLLEVPKEAAAALAYRNVALGPARSAELRGQARAHAEWELRRVAAVAAHDEASIAVQLYHEYLGVHWKNHVDAQRLHLEQFIEWAMGATA